MNKLTWMHLSMYHSTIKIVPLKPWLNPSEKSGPYTIPPSPAVFLPIHQNPRKIPDLPKKSPFYAWRWLCSCAHPTSRSYNLSTTYCCHLDASNTLSSCSTASCGCSKDKNLLVYEILRRCYSQAGKLSRQSSCSTGDGPKFSSFYSCN